MYKTLSAPLTVQIEISSMCPNNCVHCYNYWRKRDRVATDLFKEEYTQLSLSQMEHILDELEMSRVFYVVLTGGEPLMNKKSMYYALDRVEKNPLATSSINSTLITLDSSDAKALSRYKHLTSILVSIMGQNEDIHDNIAQRPGSFQETIDGIQLLKKYAVNVSVNMVVSSLNRHCIKETAQLVRNLGINNFNVTRATCPSGCDGFREYSLDLTELRNYLDDLIQIEKEYGLKTGVLTVYPLCAIKNVYQRHMTAGKRCSAGITAAAISSLGQVRVCTHVSISHGNIFEESLDTIWHKMHEWRDGSLIPSACKNCKALLICGGGCRAEAEVINGEFCAEDPLMSITDADDALDTFYRLQKSKDMPVVLPKHLMLNPNIRWRREDFGSIVYIGNQCAAFLNKEATEFLFTTRTNIIESPHDSNKLSNILPPQFVSMLYNKKY